MRKSITFAAVMSTDLNTLSCGPVTVAIDENFNREFKDASHVQWVKIKDTFQVRFYSQEKYCLAFFDQSGQLLMSGRKIQVDQVPPAVRKEMDRIRGVSEAQHDLLFVTGVYQLNHSHGTRYFINLESEALSMSILAHGNGQSEIVKKVNYQAGKASVLPSHFPGACR